MCTPKLMGIAAPITKVNPTLGTLFTGIRPGTNLGGIALDPLNLSGAFGKKESAPAPPDPATERATAEAEAAQRANTQLALNNKRRREQQSLMSKGAPTTAAPTFSFGDSAATDPTANTLSATGLTTRNTTAKRASLMSSGAPTAPAGGSYGGGGGRSQYQVALQ
jgi:hypothetical protein